MNEQVEALLQTARRDPVLRQALEQAGSAEAVVQVATAAGFAVTADDVQDVRASDVRDAELDAVGHAGVVMTIQTCWDGCTLMDGCPP